ncbi:transposase [Bradyrhizobium sp. USDA 4341]
MFLTYRIKLAPTRGQYAVLAGLCEAQRQLYNAALQERRDAWAKRKVSISRFDQCKSLTQIRSFDPDYGDVPVNLSRWTLGRVDDAMKGFFGRVKRGQKAGFPRFRSRSRWDCFGFAEWAGVRLDRNKLLFKPLTGGLRLRLHRELPPGAAVKTPRRFRGRVGTGTSAWWLMSPPPPIMPGRRRLSGLTSASSIS